MSMKSSMGSSSFEFTAVCMNDGTATTFFLLQRANLLKYVKDRFQDPHQYYYSGID